MAVGSITMCQRLPVFPETIGCVVAICGMMLNILRRAIDRLLRIPQGSVTRGTRTGRRVVISHPFRCFPLGKHYHPTGIAAKHCTIFDHALSHCVSLRRGGSKCFVF